MTKIQWGYVVAVGVSAAMLIIDGLHTGRMLSGICVSVSLVGICIHDHLTVED